MKYFSLLTLIVRFKRVGWIFSPYRVRPNKGGPERFYYNLINGINKSGYVFTPLMLGFSRVAFFLSNSYGDMYLSVCRLLGIKTVVRVDGFYLPTVFDNKEYANGRTVRKLTMSRIKLNQRLQKDLLIADFIVYQSEYSKFVADHYLYNRDRDFAIIYNGVDLELFKPRELNGCDEKINLLYLGVHRDPDLFLSSLNTYRKVNELRPDRYIFNVVGSMTEEVGVVLKEWLYKNHIIEKDIKILPFVEMGRLPGVIKFCDISIHLKSGDYCPNAVIEALACGVPVICHNWGGTKELVGDAGIVLKNNPFEYNDLLAECAAMAVIEISDNLVYYKNAARERAVKYFDRHVTALKYLEIFKGYIDN